MIVMCEAGSELSSCIIVRDTIHLCVGSATYELIISQIINFPLARESGLFYLVLKILGLVYIESLSCSFLLQIKPECKRTNDHQSGTLADKSRKSSLIP